MFRKYSYSCCLDNDDDDDNGDGGGSDEILISWVKSVKASTIHTIKNMAAASYTTLHPMEAEFNMSANIVFLSSCSFIRLLARSPVRSFVRAFVCSLINETTLPMGLCPNFPPTLALSSASLPSTPTSASSGCGSWWCVFTAL